MKIRCSVYIFIVLSTAFVSPVSAQWLQSIGGGIINCLSADGSKLYAGYGSIILPNDPYWNGILVSSDNGITWSDLDSGQIGSSVYLIAAQGSLIYAAAGHVFYDILDGDTSMVSLWRSTDGGATWSELNRKRGYRNLTGLAIHGTHLFALSSYDLMSGLLRSDDSGATWKVLSDSFYSTLAFAGSKIYAGQIYAGSGFGGLIVSTNTGDTWSSVGAPFDTNTRCGQILARDSFILAHIYARSGDFLAYSFDLGRTWAKSLLGLYGDNSLIEFDGKTVYGIEGNTSVGTSWYSRDMGKTWASLTNRPDGMGGPNLVSSLVIAGDNLVAGTQEEGIWYYPLSSLSVSAPSDAVPSVSIAPNPAMGIVTIRGASGEVVVTNVLGEVVLRAPSPYPLPKGEGISIDLSKLSAGTYFARIETAGGIVMRKVVKE